MLVYNLESTYRNYNELVAVFLVLFLLNHRAWRHAPHRAWVALPVSAFLLYLSLYSFGMPFISRRGAFMRSGTCYHPFLLALAAVALFRMLPRRRDAVTAAAFILAWYAFGDIQSARSTLADDHALYQRLRTTGQAIADDAAARRVTGEIVVMTRLPLRMKFATGFAAVQIPDEGEPLIRAVARQYGVSHVHLVEPNAAIEAAARSREPDRWLEPAGAAPGSGGELFRVLAP